MIDPAWLRESQSITEGDPNRPCRCFDFQRALLLMSCNISFQEIAQSRIQLPVQRKRSLIICHDDLQKNYDLQRNNLPKIREAFP